MIIGVSSIREGSGGRWKGFPLLIVQVNLTLLMRKLGFVWSDLINPLIRLHVSEDPLTMTVRKVRNPENILKSLPSLLMGKIERHFPR